MYFPVVEFRLEFSGDAWAALQALATLLAFTAAAGAVVVAVREHRAGEARHAEQLRSQVRPVLGVELVQVHRTDPDWTPQITVKNIGVGPARGTVVDVWLAVLDGRIDHEKVGAIWRDVDAGKYTPRRAIVGGLRAHDGERQIDLGGDKIAVTFRAGQQVVAAWRGRCTDSFLDRHDFSGVVAVYDQDNKLMAG